MVLGKVTRTGTEVTKHATQPLTQHEWQGGTVAYMGLGTVWVIRPSLQILGCTSCDKEGGFLLVPTLVSQTWEYMTVSLFSRF